MAIIDRAYLTIGDEVLSCTTLDVDIDAQVKRVEAMTRDNRILGYARGNLKIAMKAEVPINSDSEVDPVAMAASGDEFSATVEEEGGKTRTYIDCTIGKAAEKYKHGDHVTWDLDIEAKDYVDG